jgi:uncharacterized membrane protein YfcA
MAENNLFFFLMTALVGMLIGLSKGGLGGLLGSLATPLMSLVMPPEQVIGLLLPMLMFADVFAIVSYWKQWKGRLVLLLLPGGVVGVTIGTLFITHAPTGALRIGLGIIVLIFTAYKVSEKYILRWLTYEGHDWHGLLAGTMAGFSSTLAHAGGPPVAIYLLLQKIQPLEFNATNALFFAILNWIKVPYYFYARLFDFHRLLQIVWLAPIIPLGVWIGRWAAGKINRVWFERIIVVLLFATAVMLLLE